MTENEYVDEIKEAMNQLLSNSDPKSKLRISATDLFVVK